MDVVVNAVWLAYYWLVSEQDSDRAVSALESLILDWPMDFVLITGETAEEIEEKKFTYAVNMSAKVERLRNFIGLENTNLLRIVMKAADIVKTKGGGNKKPTAQSIQAWLKENVHWGVGQCPDLSTVERHLANWAALQKSPRALQLVESAVQRWGRENLLDWPSEVGVIVSKTDSATLTYVVEALYAQMWRKGTKDPYGLAELKRNIVPEILWVRTYVKLLTQRYAELLKTSPSDKPLNETVARVTHMLNSPLDLFLKMEGPDRDPTWLQALLSEALRIFMKHVAELGQGLYTSEIRGALSSTAAEKYSLDRFHKAARVSARFATSFVMAYDSLTGAAQEFAAAKDAALASQAGSAAESAAGAAASAGGHAASAETAAAKNGAAATKGTLAQFRQECEKVCRRELDARVVFLVAEGGGADIQATVTSTRLYQNLTEAVPCMGFYDVKSAKLCNIYEGEGLTHREPLLDEDDFLRFLQAVDPLLHPGRDVLWILCGRTESNLGKLRKIVAKFRFHVEVFYFCYNTKQMHQFGHWQRQRGLANSKSIEQAWYLYKGRLPKHMPKFRKDVDAGSPLFNQVLRNVPVLAPKHHAYVSKEVRQISLMSMTGVPHSDDPLEKAKMSSDDGASGPVLNQPEADASLRAKDEVAAAMKKRKLYRQTTGQEVQWFPHDNDPDLLKELCWEAGNPRWVIHGTPAGGAGIHGCLETGASVVALCYDPHHREHLQKFVLERSVEALASGGTMVFKNVDLLAWSIELNLATKPKKKKEERESEDEKKNKTEDEKKNKTTPKKPTKAKTQKKKEDSSSSSSGGAESSSSTESVKKTPKKKAKK